jgi:hypothetical protein
MPEPSKEACIVLDSDAPPRVKNPAKVRAGQIAMRARWGPPRTLRLDSLDVVTRGIIAVILSARVAAALDVPEAALFAPGAPDAAASALLEVATEAIAELLGEDPTGGDAP